jgi:hypothetical protein
MRHINIDGFLSFTIRMALDMVDIQQWAHDGAGQIAYFIGYHPIACLPISTNPM